MFFLQDGFFMIPVHPKYKIGKERGQRQRDRQVGTIQAGEHAADTNLVIILIGTHIKTEQNGYDGNQVYKFQLSKISFDVYNQGHDEEVGKIQEVLSCTQPFHIVHDNQVEIEVDDGNYTGQFKPFFRIEVES